MKYNTIILRGFMSENEITNQDMAKIINVHPRTFREKLSNQYKREFTLSEAKRIAEFIGLTIEEVFFYSSVPKKDTKIN
ncbi:hypothetical protein U472_00325 [Orenia metallireducens]|jgi:DNA-binding XRE family transcriptional regulator|uniref:HTH cro/C1-type domain-containing protein n=1 Tax=Orenia metallireducens TaxID=1413210 RepID=A0A1C0ADE6_9FIRM|nr:helix-turn-helix transcriptional regulator [Orenia metallireducens]OCL28636.1 hypothetical protein U472_00325 [Orenia metallireducens]